MNPESEIIHKISSLIVNNIIVNAKEEYNISDRIINEIGYLLNHTELRLLEYIDKYKEEFKLFGIGTGEKKLFLYYNDSPIIVKTYV